MVATNILIFSRMVAKAENIKRVVWIGGHIDQLEYFYMSSSAFKVISKNEAELIYPTYHSFLGSLGLLLSNDNLHDL